MNSMSASATRSTARAFFEAYAARDAARVAALLADDVVWTMAGPIGVFPFCGVRRGKAAVLDSIFRIKPGTLTVILTEIDDILIDGDGAGAFGRITARHAASGRMLSYHCAYFLVFRDDKLAVFEVVTDTFGIAEQVLGHRIDAFSMPDVMAEDHGLIAL
jgi:ketosteroid isomerase-like protein